MNNFQSDSYLNSFNSFFEVNDSDVVLDVIYANIRSMRKNFNSLILELDRLNKEIDVIVLCEIWINSDEIELFHIKGYNTFYCCNDNYRAGGVICYIKDYINVTNLNITMMTADVSFLKIKTSNMFFNLLCIYRLHSSSERDYINEITIKLSNLANYSVIIGDINLDILNKSQSTQDYLTMLSGFGFTQIINCPTRITDLSKSCIDHIFIRHKDLSIFSAAVFDICLSDHCLLGLKIFKKNA